METRRIAPAICIAGATALLAVLACDSSGRKTGDAAPDTASRDAVSAEDVSGDDSPSPKKDASGDSGGPGCSVFPPDNPWNTDISSYPVHASSATFIASIGPDKGLHPDFGTEYQGAPNGIPYVIVPGDQPKVPIVFTVSGDESDPGPYPIPDDAPIEGGPNGTGDRHVIAVDLTNCALYELYSAIFLGPNKGWEAKSGAVFDLTSNTLRTIGWTSADAAGLPIFPGLVRYDEVQAGAIKHALRFTVSSTQRAYVLPATHWASSSTDPDRPPMGLRLRLKASVVISGFSKSNQVILKALQTYGMFVADNGGDWFLSGAPNQGWDDDDLHQLLQIKGKDFEVVETGPILTTY